MAGVIDVIDALGEMFPWQLAPPGDGGLLLGSPGAAVERVMCCLDLGREAVRAAVGAGCQALVGHHPQLLRAGGNLHWDSAAGAVAREACVAGLNLIGCHANADQAAGGSADSMAGRLGIRGARPLEPSVGAYIAKVVTFVPPGHVEAVSAAMSKAGAGVMGDYTNCGFRAPGKGTFLPGPGAHPFTGRPGELSVEEETRIEMVTPSFRVEAVTAAMIDAHPYEEVAFDVYRTENPVPWGRGRVGDLPGKRTAGELADEISEWCGSEAPALYGGRRAEVGRVAVAPGAGGRLVGPALSAGAELMVTGEMDWHSVREGREGGMTVLCLGHLASERQLVPLMAGGLRREFRRRGLPVAVEECVDHEGRCG